MFGTTYLPSSFKNCVPVYLEELMLFWRQRVVTPNIYLIYIFFVFLFLKAFLFYSMFSHLPKPFAQYCIFPDIRSRSSPSPKKRLSRSNVCSAGQAGPCPVTPTGTQSGTRMRMKAWNRTRPNDPITTAKCDPAKKRTPSCKTSALYVLF